MSSNAAAIIIIIIIIGIIQESNDNTACQGIYSTIYIEMLNLGVSFSCRKMEIDLAMWLWIRFFILHLYTDINRCTYYVYIICCIYLSK